MSNKLTDKQRAFVQEYLLDLNATQASIRAGYSEKTARVIGPENLAKPHIQEAIAKAQEQRLKRVELNADYVLNELRDIREMDIGDILDDNGNVLAIKRWPKVWRTTLSAIDIQELIDGDVQAFIKKIKWPDKLATLKLIGQHINIQAFKEKVEHSGEVGTPIINLTMNT